MKKKKKKKKNTLIFDSQQYVKKFASFVNKPHTVSIECSLNYFMSVCSTLKSVINNVKTKTSFTNRQLKS